MSKIKIAEIFHSLQGEGLWMGQPSVFVRTFGCNFQCSSFGMPIAESTPLVYERSKEADHIAAEYAKHPEWKYGNLPLAKTGCDSYASWHPKFKGLSPMLTAEAIVNVAEYKRKEHNLAAINNGSSHLVITGGEPLLGWQRAYPELIDAFVAKGYNEITFETNGTQRIANEFADYMYRQALASEKRVHYTFSVSPKLPSSGEAVEDALRPDAIMDYVKHGTTYLKFVVATEFDLHNVHQYVRAYRSAGFTGEVYLMPCGGTPESYHATTVKVAEYAMMHGFRYSPRLQVDLFKNAWST
jgi:7-carboxy-7-deazaguanine synthase